MVVGLRLILFFLVWCLLLCEIMRLFGYLVCGLLVELFGVSASG